LMFLATGYQNVGSEGYRKASHTLFGMLETAKTNFFTITKYTTEENWLLIGAITLFCLLLLCKWEGKTRKEHLWKAGSLLCLTVPLVFFYANRYILESLRFSGTLQIITFLADIAFNLLYLAGLVITICFCVVYCNLFWNNTISFCIFVYNINYIITFHGAPCVC